jgi:DNA processing protein
MHHETLAAWYLLDTVRGFGPGKCQLIYRHALKPTDVLDDPERLPVGGKIGEKLRSGLRQITDEQRKHAQESARRDLERAAKLDAEVLSYGHPYYPRRLSESNLPVPFLFVRGDLTALQPKAVACVGSRSIREPYSTLLAKFAAFAADDGYLVVSGFATGADTIAHDAAVDAGGTTVAVLPNGLDLVFPPENRSRWQQWLERPGVALVSDFRFGRRADALALRKRNKLIVALAGAVLVGQSAVRGGAMNAFRFGVEQKKAVATFAPDHEEGTAGNAEIAQPQKVPTVAFPREPDPDQWSEWLATFAGQ